MDLGEGDETNQNNTDSEVKDYEIGLIIEQIKANQYDRLFRLPSSSFSLECSIYRVPEPLRSVNSKSYTPQVISIGPLHHAKKDPMAMEQKWRYFQNFSSLSKLILPWPPLVKLVMRLEERARKFYAEPFEMNRGEFVELLIMDGCFVVMYIIGSQFPEFQDIDTSFIWRFGNGIFCDLLLLENQLPFFVLQALYDLCASSETSLKGFSFIELARKHFITPLEGFGYVKRDVSVDASKVNHFVDFLRMHLAHSCFASRTLDLIDTSFPCFVWPPTATELHDCGVSFKKKKVYKFCSREKCMMDMAFKVRGGVLKMSQIIIDDRFVVSLRNLIAYEQCHHKSEDVSNFAMFMHFLINTNKDVSLLIDNGIIQNKLGSIKEITRFFNDLCKHVVVGRNVYHSECERMIEHCKRRRHRWMTSLRRDYFNTPWAFVSFIAAVLLLALTLVQAVTAIVALYSPPCLTITSTDSNRCPLPQEVKGTEKSEEIDTNCSNERERGKSKE